MIYLILAILLSTAIIITFKFFDKYQIDNFQAIVINYLIASFLGFAICKEPVSFSGVISQTWIWYAVIIGCFLALAFYIFALSAQKVGVALTAVSSKMSVVIPVAFGIIIFKENLNLIKIIGIGIALLAFYFTFKKDADFKFKKRYLILPIVLFIANGTNDTLMKFTEKNYFHNDELFFLSSAFFVSLIVGIILIIIKSISGKIEFKFKHLFAGIILGLLNFGSTYFFLIALGKFESSIFFPIFNVSIVSCAALVGFFGFKEKLRPINWIGIGMAIFAIVIIAMA